MEALSTATPRDLLESSKQQQDSDEDSIDRIIRPSAAKSRKARAGTDARRRQAAEKERKRRSKRSKTEILVENGCGRLMRSATVSLNMAGEKALAKAALTAVDLLKSVTDGGRYSGCRL